jgi:anti-sigma regulatory factor (Ser/Thr protein kinase)
VSELNVTLPGDADAPMAARASVAALAGELTPERLDDLALVVSELVTNGVEHGRGEEIGISVAIGGDGRTRGEVTNAGCPSAELLAADDDPEMRQLGLRLVDRLCARWGVQAGSTHVWFEL